MENNQFPESLIQRTSRLVAGGGWRAMKSRWFWLMSLFASVTLFIANQLKTFGETIAKELERAYASSEIETNFLGKKSSVSPIKSLRVASYRRFLKMNDE
jgi:hypothetical protein